MIKTTRQLKDKINNMSDGNPQKAQTLFRNYIMERFLERISLSEYKRNFILKGGMLVASLVGMNLRATMDVDTTVRSIPLTLDDAQEIVNEIIAIKTDDNVAFEIKSAEEIMEEHDYPGIRLKLEAQFENSRQTIKLDISTGDVITPEAVEYEYPLMFEDRTVSLYSYNIETLLAEKLETIMARGETNTRMRDFYDIYVISQNETIDFEDLHNAFVATCKARNTDYLVPQIYDIFDSLVESESMIKNWDNYKNNNFYVDELSWQEAINKSIELVDSIVTDELLFENDNPNDDEEEGFEITM